MRKIFTLFVISTLFVFPSLSQVSEQRYVDFDYLLRIEYLQDEHRPRIDAAFAAMDAVRESGAFIEALTDLFSDQIITFPVGIRKGDYELIIHRINHNRLTGRKMIYATCAFKFRDTGQRIAFEGYAEITGRGGFANSGQLTLIAPVERQMGSHSSLIIREGTTVRFGCEGIESFDARLAWRLTSDRIIPTNNQGTPTNRPLAVSFDAHFQNFDNYMVSLNIDQSFMIRGLSDVIFTLGGATLDQSDIETSSMIQFPENYLQGIEEFNLWRGVAISEASISLPQVFQRESGSNERVILSLQNAIFDQNGFSTNVSAQNIIPSDNINPEEWAMSLDDFYLGILRNNIYSFGFSGDINMPPFGENSLFTYTATFNLANEEYEFNVNLAGEFDFPVLHSTIRLNELSTIDIALRDGSFFPTIRASGTLSINAPLGSGDQTFSVPDISFENLIITRESPFLEIGAIGLSGPLRSPSIAGFELSISDIQSFNNAQGSGLRFETGVSLSDMFSGNAGIRLYGDYQNWQFREVVVDRVNVDFQSRAFSLIGGVWFKSGDPIFGDGFRGDVTMTLIEKFELEAVGVFGKVDGFRYFLTDAFFDAGGMGGIPAPPLTFTGFGGGLYSRMQQSIRLPNEVARYANLEFGRSLSGISYLPDRTVGMGVMATTTFNLASSRNAFNAKVGLEMQFNSSGGLNFVQFRGDAAFMDTPDRFGNLSDNIMQNLARMEQAGITQPQRANRNDLINPPANQADGFLTASINIEYDFINSIFSADLNCFLNAGIVRGAGANNRLGWASARFSPDSWHMHLGTPNDRLGISLLNLAQATGYFMLGDNMPALPPPPPQVMRHLSADKRARLTRSSSNDLSLGRGIAFGSAFETQFDARLFPFFARMEVGLGAEFLLSDLRGRVCEGFSGTPGINGWFAQVQAWAYVNADIGMEARLFGRTRTFSILDISTGALLQGSGPNPIHLGGMVGGRFSVLGGLISGNARFEFEIGKRCILVGSGSPFGEDIIAQLTPNPGARDVNVFAAPQAVFNVAVGREMTINDEGSRVTYMVTLEEFTVRYTDGRIVSGRSEISSDGTVAMFTPDEPFESQMEMEVFAKVGFKRRINHTWEHVRGGDGQPVFEYKRTRYTTGDRPLTIAQEHVRYSYPTNRQLNFHVNEYYRGFILLSQNYAFLFEEYKPEGFDQILRFTDSRGNSQETTFTHRASNQIGSNIRLEIDFSLENIALNREEIYQLSIVNVPQQENLDLTSNIVQQVSAMDTGTGSDLEITRREATETLAQLSEKIIYSLHFRTSVHSTFAEKIRLFDNRDEGWRRFLHPSVHEINLNLRQAEFFDDFEIRGDSPFIRMEAVVDETAWFTQTFYQGMYRRHTHHTPPVDRIEIRRATGGSSLSVEEINAGVVTSAIGHGLLVYNLPHYLARDLHIIRKEIAVRRINDGQISAADIALLNTNRPPIVFQGYYPININYTLPGRNIITSTVRINVFNPVVPNIY